MSSSATQDKDILQAEPENPPFMIQFSTTPIIFKEGGEKDEEMHEIDNSTNTSRSEGDHLKETSDASDDMKK